MEYVDGFELGRLAPSLEFQQRARIMKEVCEAVHHAHDVGVQHRDLKPSNIMLDAELRPKILDFGLSSGDPARGHFRGTPRYLAPEQLDASQPIDARTDVYALGAVLYELLTGVPPVGGGPRTTSSPTSAPARSACRWRSRPACRSRSRPSRSRPSKRGRGPLSVGARHGARPRALPRRPPGDGPAEPVRQRADGAHPPAPRPDRGLAAPEADPPARGRPAPVGVPRPRAARRRLDRREPGAVVLADRAVPRRVPADVRQPVLLRRAPVLPRREGRAAAVRRARRAVRRPEPRRAPARAPRRTRPWRWPSTSAASACCRCSC